MPLRNVAYRYWTLCNGGTNVFSCGWHVWYFWKELPKWIGFLCKNYSIVSRNSSIGTSVHFSLNRFCLLTMTLLLLSIRNPAISRVSIGWWVRNCVMKCVLQTLLDVKRTVFSNSLTSRWCQHNCCPTPVFAVSAHFSQLSIPSSSVRKNYWSSRF